MKKSLLLVAFTAIACFLYAQAPQGFNYQCIVRDATNAPISDQIVTLLFSIRQGDPSGAVVYTETHQVNTNEFGLVNLIVGQGTPTSGTFNALDWGGGAKYLKVFVQEGATITELGTTQLMSVPYALFAQKAPGDNWGSQAVQTNSSLTGNGTVSSPLSLAQQGAAQGQALKWNGTAWVPQDDAVGGGGTANNYSGGTGINVTGTAPNFVINNNGDLSNTNEIQTLSITGNNLSLSAGGGTVALPSGPAGPMGATGLQGPQGPIGLTGQTGPMGATGPQGLEGPQGPIGLTGQTGPMGATGLQGPQGPIGLTGQTGSMGAQGPQGPEGPQGQMGLTGQIGPIGPQGPVGPQGPPGPTYTAGNGIGITSNIISNTGDTNASDDITTASSAGGDLSGPFNNLQVVANAINSTELAIGAVTMPKLAQSGATNGQVIKWNGNAWAPGNDATGGSSGWTTLAQDTLTNTNTGPVKLQKQTIINYTPVNPQLPTPAMVINHNWMLGRTRVHLKNSASTGTWDFNGGFGSTLNTSTLRFDYLPDASGVIKTPLSLFGSGSVGINVFTNSGPEYVLKIQTLSSNNYGLNLINSTGGANWEFAPGVDGPLYLYSHVGHVATINHMTGAYLAQSDRKLKRAFEPLEGVLEKIEQLQPLRYEFIKGNPKHLKSLGFIAQDIQVHFPELVSEINDGRSAESTLMMDYSGLGVVAIAGLKELAAKVETLTAQNKALEAKNEALEARLLAIEKLLERK